MTASIQAIIRADARRGRQAKIVREARRDGRHYVILRRTRRVMYQPRNGPNLAYRQAAYWVLFIDSVEQGEFDLRHQAISTLDRLLQEGDQ